MIFENPTIMRQAKKEQWFLRKSTYLCALLRILAVSEVSPWRARLEWLLCQITEFRSHRARKGLFTAGRHLVSSATVDRVLNVARTECNFDTQKEQCGSANSWRRLPACAVRTFPSE